MRLLWKAGAVPERSRRVALAESGGVKQRRCGREGNHAMGAADIGRDTVGRIGLAGVPTIALRASVSGRFCDQTHCRRSAMA